MKCNSFRFIGHRAAMNFDKLHDMTGYDYDNHTDLTDLSMTVPNMIEKIMLKTNGRIIKHSMNQQSPSREEKMESFLKARESKTKSRIEEFPSVTLIQCEISLIGSLLESREAIRSRLRSILYI